MESSDSKNCSGQIYSLKPAHELSGNELQNDQESHPSISSSLVISMKTNLNNTQCLSQLECTDNKVLANNIEQNIEYIDAVHQNSHLIDESSSDKSTAEHFLYKSQEYDESNCHIRSLNMTEIPEKSFSSLFSSPVNAVPLSISNSTNNSDRKSNPATESLNSPEMLDKDKNRNPIFKPNELINQLIEGPQITLPTSQLPLETMKPCQDTFRSMLQDSSSSLTKQSSDIEQSSSQSIVQQNLGVSFKTNNGGIRPSEASACPSDISSGIQQSSSATNDPKAKSKKTPNDFIFGKVIGEGSYSTVYLAREVSTQREYAIKVCDKMHLIRERKTHIVMREKEVLMKLDHPYFIKLAYTFQDSERLFSLFDQYHVILNINDYVLTLARNGELLGFLHKLSAFDVPCTRFYTAELVLALEYLQKLNIIHRDIKPENILLGDDMHLKITDFGTSKILTQEDIDGYESEDDEEEEEKDIVEDVKPVEVSKRKNSFVGTAEYVSPEVIRNKLATFGSDLWALGCIIYLCLSGSVPFTGSNDYQKFLKILKLDYEFPQDFPPEAKDLVKKLLVLKSRKRLGMVAPDGMKALKSHPFYSGIDWEKLPQTTPPILMPNLPAPASNEEIWQQNRRTGFDDKRLAEIITGQTADGSRSPEIEHLPIKFLSQADDDERKEKLRKQREENPFHQFVNNNLILKQGFVDKRKGLFARKRMLLLTEGPHLYYVDAHNKVLKGEIPWSKRLHPEVKSFKGFLVHTPNRTYHLESRSPDAQLWVNKINEVWLKYYGPEETK
ncbi:unnamed protein product [Lymnaea stagnalis]|uniref:3-phosphoinositide-dependent protein kinase 1 n=1 Tax=Lymnaea stagnalis TaxID=6523 RepID=A0AAV2I1V1_LYMST